MTQTVLVTPSDSDMDPLAALSRQSFVETFGHLYKAEDLNAFLAASRTADSLRRQIARPGMELRMAMVEGACAGYCLIGPNDLPGSAPERIAMELHQLYVLAPWQGAGVAAALMDWAMTTFRHSGAQDVFLSVWSQNERAQRFYRRYGFDWFADWHFMVGSHQDEEYIFYCRLQP